MEEHTDRVLGIDTTVSDSMGWCLVDSGIVIAHGQLPVDSLSRLVETSDRDLALRSNASAMLTDLIARYAPPLVAIEYPVSNSARVQTYIDEAIGQAPGRGESVARRLAAMLRDTIRLGMMAGNLEHAAQAAGCLVVLVNPAQAKYEATGAIVANKKTMREAARLLLAAQCSDEHTRTRTPSEHEADAIFIALAGRRLARERAWLASVQAAEGQDMHHTR